MLELVCKGDLSLSVEIVLLALIALFVGLRLYSVLGKRTGHEQQQPLPHPEAAPPPLRPAATPKAIPEAGEPTNLVYEPGAATGMRAIIAAEPHFDIARFLEGAEAAYRQILEGFWKGEKADYEYLVAPEVRSLFDTAIAEREAAGHTLDNRLVSIGKTHIEQAELNGREARITVRFDADIAAVTRDKDGNLVAGTMTDAVESHDVWTFQRTLGSNDPSWLLVDTDEAE